MSSNTCRNKRLVGEVWRSRANFHWTMQLARTPSDVTKAQRQLKQKKRARGRSSEKRGLGSFRSLLNSCNESRHFGIEVQGARVGQYSNMIKTRLTGPKFNRKIESLVIGDLKCDLKRLWISTQYLLPYSHLSINPAIISFLVYNDRYYNNFICFLSMTFIPANLFRDIREEKLPCS